MGIYKDKFGIVFYKIPMDEGRCNSGFCPYINCGVMLRDPRDLYSKGGKILSLRNLCTYCDDVNACKKENYIPIEISEDLDLSIKEITFTGKHLVVESKKYCVKYKNYKHNFPLKEKYYPVKCQFCKFRSLSKGNISCGLNSYDIYKTCKELSIGDKEWLIPDNIDIYEEEI